MATRPTGTFSVLPRERNFVTRFGTIRLRIARTREKSFLPVGLKRFQRRAEEVSLLIREAFLRGISTRQVGRVVATITGETVSAQTVSKLTRDLDEAVRRCGSFIRRGSRDDYVYLFLDGEGHYLHDLQYGYFRWMLEHLGHQFFRPPFNCACPCHSARLLTRTKEGFRRGLRCCERLHPSPRAAVYAY